MNHNQLKIMSDQIVQTYKEYEKTGTKSWTYEIAVKDLVYQVGSLMKLVMQKQGERFSDNKSEIDLKEEISDELADILAEVLFIAHELDIDLEEAWGKMLESDQNKISKRI